MVGAAGSTTAGALGTATTGAVVLTGSADVGTDVGTAVVTRGAAVVVDC